MNKNNMLNVWHEKEMVGQIWRDEIGHMGFRYEKNWMAEGFAISQQLPLSEEDFPPGKSKAHQFFANLLPEAGARQHLVKDLKITNSDFELLKAIGGECAGALSILPLDYNPSTKSHYKKLTSTDMATLILGKGNVASFLNEKNRPRLSLAGAQDKCPVLFDGKDYYLPQNASPSTHIIKFETRDYRHIPAYEYFLTLLAKAIDLPTVECQLKQFDQHRFLLIQRYDRVNITLTNIQRLHQEDFCQALGFSYEHKYQQENGPTFYDCYQLILNISTSPIIDAENLLKWQIFNCLGGNSDGHAKNLSLIYTPQNEIRLAPFYDLVCTRAIQRIDKKLAFSVGNEFNPDMLSIHSAPWDTFSKQCGIRSKYLFEMIYEIAEALLNNLDSTQEKFEKENGDYPALQRIKAIVTKQCKRILKMK